MKKLKRLTAFICILAVVFQLTEVEPLVCNAKEAATQSNATNKKKEICFKKRGIVYRVIAKEKVEVCGFTQNKKTISIPAKVKYKGISYKVTQIADMKEHGAYDTPEVYMEGEHTELDFPAGYSAPDGVAVLDQSDISCSKLILPKTIEYIGEGAFYKCKIEEVEFSSQYKKLVIGKYAFGSWGPDKIAFPEGTNEIQDYATFYVSDITIPQTVKNMGSGVISFNTKKVNINAKNKKFKMKSGMLYTKDEKNLIGITEKITKKSKIKVSSKTRNMSDYVFYGCQAKEIDLGGKVTEISKGAFRKCKKLKKVTGTKSVKKIGFGAFDGCQKLKKIEDVSNVTIIEDAAFWGTKKLTLPISAKMDIAPNAFAGTYRDSSVGMKIVIPENDSVYSIENGLMIKTQGDSKTIIRQTEFYENIEIPEGVTTIAVALGNREKRYKEVIFPESLKKHTGCVYTKEGTVTYKSTVLPEFDRGFYIKGSGTIIVPKGMLEYYKKAIEEASQKISVEYEDGLYFDDHYYDNYSDLKIQEAQ